MSSKVGMTRYSRAGVFRFKRVLRGAALRVALALGTRRNVESIPVYFDPEFKDIDDLTARISAALQLVRSTAPRRWQRLVRDVSRLHCTKLGRPGAHYDHSIAACVIDADYVRGSPASFLAASVIHEATHARIEKAGIAYLPVQRHRIERRCMVEEIDFAEALAGDQAHLLTHLRSAIDSVWYSDEQFAERLIARYRALGIPPWMIHWLQRGSEPRARRTSRPVG